MMSLFSYAKEQAKINLKIKPQIKEKPKIKSQIRAKPRSKIQLTIKDPCSACDSATESWSEKYRPLSIDHLSISGSQRTKQLIKSIQQWFTDPNRAPALLFYGASGTSKTTIARCILTYYQYKIIEYNTSDLRNKSLLEKNINQLLSTRQFDQQPMGLILDEIDGGSVSGINYIIGLLDIMKKSQSRLICGRDPPIICICNQVQHKKIIQLKKRCLALKFEKPSLDDLIKSINLVARSEHLVIDESSAKVLAKMAQGDYRRLMFLLQNFTQLKLQETSGGVSLVHLHSNDFYQYYDTITQKQIDLNLFQSTEKIFERQLPIDQLDHIYQSNQSLILMMIHENYLSSIASLNTNEKTKHQLALKCIDTIINADHLEHQLYAQQQWQIRPLHNICCTLIPNYLLNSTLKVGRKRSRFPMMLTNYSQQRSKYKQMVHLLFQSKMFSVEHMQKLAQLIRSLDDTGQRKLLKEYLSAYSLNSENDLYKLLI